MQPQLHVAAWLSLNLNHILRCDGDKHGAIQRCKHLALSESLACFHYRSSQSTDKLVFLRLQSTIASTANDASGQLGEADIRSLNLSIVHKTPVTSFALSCEAGIIYTASCDSICSWRVDERFLFDNMSSSSTATSRPILPLQTFPHSMGCISLLEAVIESRQAQDQVLVCAVENAIWLTMYDDVNINCINLGAHLGRVTALKTFITDSARYAISGSEDRTFKVFNIGTKACVFTSGVISTHPLTSFCITSGRLLAATADGALFMFDMQVKWSRATVEFAPRLLKKWSISSFFRFQPHKASINGNLMPLEADIWGLGNMTGLAKALPLPDIVQTSEIPLHLQSANFLLPHHKAQLQLSLQKKNASGSLCNRYPSSHLFMVASNSGIVFISAVSTEVVFQFDWRQTRGANASICASFLGGHMLVLIYDAFSGEAHICRLSSALSSSIPNSISFESELHQILSTKLQGTWLKKLHTEYISSFNAANMYTVQDVWSASDDELARVKVPRAIKDALIASWKSLLAPSAEPVTLSLLPKSIIVKQENGTVSTSDISTSSSKKKISATKRDPQYRKQNQHQNQHQTAPRILDKPVTFHKKVKSSGYLTAEPSSKKYGTKPTKSTKLFMRTATAIVTNRYDWSDATSLSTPMLCSTVRCSSGVTTLQYSPDGKRIACGLVGKTVHIFKSSEITANADPVRSFSAHETPVTHLQWSSIIDKDDVKRTGRLVTCSTDGVGRLWAEDATEPLLTLKPSKMTSTTSLLHASLPSSRSSQPFACKAISSLQFWNSDKHLLAVSLKTLCILSYKILSPNPSLIEPAMNCNSYRLKSFHSFSSNISSVLPLQHMKRSLVAVAMGTTLSLYDATAEACVSVGDCAHSRSIYHLFGSHQQSSLVFSCAVTDGIKGWDPRVNTIQSVIQLLHHVNRHAIIKSAASPCGRYVASGSEDRHVFIYDIRNTQSAIHRFAGGFTDAVTAVDFHPYRCRLAAGGQDGKICQFDLEAQPK